MGHYLPQRQVSSSQLEQKLGLEAGWILRTNGVRYRHYVNEEETGAFMGAQALREALENAQIAFEELDLIIEASGSFDFPIPHNACLIPRELGYPQAGIPCWDIDSTCLGFVTALDTASYLLDGQRYKHIAIINSEIASKSLNPKQPKSATLFGDAATAAIVSYTAESTSGVVAADMQTFSQGAHYTRVKGGGNALHPNTSSRAEDFTFAMEGKAVMRLGIQKIVPFVEQLLADAAISMEAIDCFVPHQASKMALDFVHKTFGWPQQKTVSVLADYGNCISASIPLALYMAIERQQLQEGQSCLLLGTAAGLSVGGLLFVY